MASDDDRGIPFPIGSAGCNLRTTDEFLEDAGPAVERNPLWVVDRVGDELLFDRGQQGFTVGIATPEAARIVDRVPFILEAFLKKNAKYASAQVHDLGAMGIVPDVNRKTAVLIERLWNHAHDAEHPCHLGEPTVEVIDDLIGHLLLMRDKLER